MEKWKRIIIDNIETNYEISTLGNCRNILKLGWKTKGLLKPRFNKQNGYESYNLVVEGKNYYKYRHRLVAEAFIPNPKNLEQVNHIDGNKRNNMFENLEWCDREYNMKHCFDNELCSTAKKIKLYNLKGEYINTFISITEAIKYILGDERNTYGINAEVLKQEEDNIYCQQLGYQWRLENDIRRVIDIEDICSKQNIPIVKCDMQDNFITCYFQIHQAYIDLGKTDNGCISQVCKSKRSHAYGYKWYYLNEWRERNR